MQRTSVTDRAGLSKEQAALRRVATLVADGGSADDVFAAVTREVAGLFDAAAASLSRFEGDSCVVVAACRSGFPIGSRWPLDVDSLAKRVLATGRPVYVDNYSEIARQLPDAQPVRPTDAAVGVPIVAQGGLWGLLSVGAPELSPAPSETVDRITAFAELVATAISNAEARRELQRVATEQSALRRAATLVASGASPQEVFDAITISASEIFGVPFSSLIRVGADQTATMVAGCAACRAYVGTTWRVPADDPGITRTVLKSQRPSRIEDHSGVHGPLGEAARALGIGSVVGAPVIVDDAIWGVLAIGAAQEGPPLPADAGDRLIGFTELVTTTLINAETREGLRRLAHTQASLRRIATLVAEGASADELFSAVAREVSVVLGVPVVNVDRYELEGGSPVSVVVASLDDEHFRGGSRWPLDGPSARAWIYETGRPVRIEDFSGLESTSVNAAREQGVRWIVGAPIVVDGLVWGGIYAGTTGDEPIPDDAESRLADFTELVSTAIANSDAHEKVGRLLDEQAALRRVATLVAAEVEPDELFSAVSDEVARLFASDGAGIARFEPDGSGVVAAGVSKILHTVPVGARIDLDDSLASTEVYRTGRAARKDTRGEDVHATGVIGDMLRGLSSFGTVAAPIRVAGSLWGTVITFSTRMPFPSDTEERLEKFGELVATAIANAESRNDLAAAEARARALAEEQAALRRVATLVARGVPPSEIFSAVSNEVERLFRPKVDATAAAGVIKFEADESVLVGTTRSMEAVPLGSRWGPKDLYASTRVRRTGRSARVSQSDLAAIGGPDAEFLRGLGYLSQVASPIVVEGQLWGAVTMNAAEALPPETEEWLEKFTELVATAIANAQSRGDLAASERRARALAEEQAALRRVATLVARGVDPDELFVAVCDEVAGLVNAEVTTIGRFDRNEPHDITVVGLSSGFGGIATGTRWPQMDWLASSVVYRTGRTARKEVNAEQITGAGELADAVRAMGFFSTVSAPIVVEGELWGVVTASTTRASLPPNTERRVESFSELVATAIADAQSRAELAASEARARALAEEQAALRRVATLVAGAAVSDQFFSVVAREVAAVLNVHGVILTRYESDGMAVVFGDAFDSELSGAEAFFSVGSRAPSDPGSLAAQVLETHGPARVDDFSTLAGTVGDLARAAGFGSGCAGPIVVNGELWGKMCVFSGTGAPLPVGTEDRLNDFIELVAMAIANHEARAELAASEARARELAREQAALRRVATLVAEGAKPNRVFDAVRDEVARMFGLPRTVLMRYDPDGTATLLATIDDWLGPVGKRWSLGDDDSSVARVRRTGRAARVDYAAVRRGAIALTASRAGVRHAVAVPIVVEGALWGVMSVSSDDPDPLAADLERRLAQFTELLATAIANAESRAELAASRARLVATADATRRRIERDLHDGIQQWLVTLALKARKAATFSVAVESAAPEFSDLADDLVAVTDELREITRGIHPAILTDAGLDDALEALARRSAIRVDLDVGFEGRYDPTLEATVYYVVAESITNAVKHAQASCVEVRGGLRDGAIDFEIKDDGVGGADPRRGTGMIGLKDRVDTLGGTISFASPAGAGTTIRVSLPARPGDWDDLLGERSDEAASAPASG